MGFFEKFDLFGRAAKAEREQLNEQISRYHDYLMQGVCSLERLNAQLAPYEGRFTPHPDDPRIITIEDPTILHIFSEIRGIRTLLLKSDSDKVIEQVSQLTNQELQAIPDTIRIEPDANGLCKLVFSSLQDEQKTPDFLKEDLTKRANYHLLATGYHPKVITKNLKGTLGAAAHIDGSRPATCEERSTAHYGGEGTRLYIQNDEQLPSITTKTDYAVFFRAKGLTVPKECAQRHKSTQPIRGPELPTQPAKCTFLFEGARLVPSNVCDEIAHVNDIKRNEVLVSHPTYGPIHSLN